MSPRTAPEALWAGDAADVITGVVGDQVHAIPRGRIRRAVERDRALAAARTFADVRAARAAGHDVPDVDDSDWVEYFIEDGVVEEGERIPDDTPFDVGTHPAYCESQWCSTLEQGTSSFLPTAVKERFGHPDTGWGVDYEPTDVVLRGEDIDAVEGALREDGWTVVRDADVVVHYS